MDDNSEHIQQEIDSLRNNLQQYLSGQKTLDDIFVEEEPNTQSENLGVTDDDEDTDFCSYIDNDNDDNLSNIPENNYSSQFDTSSMGGEMMMFPEAQLRVSDVLLMTTVYAVEKNLSQRDQDDLIDLIKVLAGPQFEHWSASHYLRSKCYDPLSDKINVHFFCVSCNQILNTRELKNIAKKESKICEKCLQMYELSSKEANYFITIDIEYQLQLLLNEPTLQSSLLQNISEIEFRSNNNVICDIYDSYLYKKLQSQLPGTLTLNFNADGAPLFKSSRLSFWPIQLYINELPPKMRFKNRLLAGLFVTETEPKPDFMQLYLSAFCEQIRNLQEKGVYIINHSIRELISFKFYIFCGCVDTVARAVMQNRVQFNGYWGCSWCYIHGDFRSGSVRYLLSEGEQPLRNHEQYVQNASHASEVNNMKPSSKRAISILGVKSKSAFAEKTPLFDCIWGFPVEYQHGTALGIVQQLWYLWTTETKNKLYGLKPADLVKIDARLSLITPSHEIPRSPKPTSQFAQWKASQLDAWIKYWCIPCLDGILDAILLKSLSLFVESIHTLSKSYITESDFVNTEYNLMQFVGECQKYYGESALTFNIHALLHYVQSVKSTGPLWATSSYPFEDGIGRCKEYVNGPRGVSHQIAKKTLKRLRLRLVIDENTDSQSCKDYCHRLFEPRRIANYVKISDKITLLGIGEKNTKIETKMKRHFGKQKIIMSIFNRCIYDDFVLHGNTYGRAIKRNDSIVLIKSGQIIAINHFIVVDDICYLSGKELIHSPAIFSNGITLNHIHQICSDYSKNEVIVEITCIDKKMMTFPVDKRHLLVYLSNTFEKQ